MRALIVTALLIASPTAIATPVLIAKGIFDLGNGTIYDAKQDLTWVQDVMLSRTLGADADSRMTLAEAEAWAAGLVYGGHSDWRLPSQDPDGIGGSHIFNASISEVTLLMANFGWHYDGWDYINGTAGPFQNFLGQDNAYLIWLTGMYWWAPFAGVDFADDDFGTAWAVRDGGNPFARVPEPGTLGLLSLGLLGAWVSRRSRPSSRR